jgi:7-cyano-7-deazaguanine synthase in queuosine biosynthesis
MQYSNASYSALPLHVARRQPKILYPLIDMTKRDIIKEIPIELLRLCWWCRRPRDGAECHRCHTCRQVDPVLREIGFSRKEGADAHVSV